MFDADHPSKWVIIARRLTMHVLHNGKLIGMIAAMPGLAADGYLIFDLRKTSDSEGPT